MITKFRLYDFLCIITIKFDLGNIINLLKKGNFTSQTLLFFHLIRLINSRLKTYFGFFYYSAPLEIVGKKPPLPKWNKIKAINLYNPL